MESDREKHGINIHTNNIYTPVSNAHHAHSTYKYIILTTYTHHVHSTYKYITPHTHTEHTKLIKQSERLEHWLAALMLLELFSLLNIFWTKLGSSI